MDERIAQIDIDDLDTDICNIRGGLWDHDSELIQSIKDMGIQEPLIVRPVKSNENVKYGIVCGSRRYHAALEAGLKEVPCIVRALNDDKAMGLSLAENLHRKDIPTWKNIEWIGRLCKRAKNHDRIVQISKLTGLQEQRIRYYLDIYCLPEEVKGLMRELGDRTKRQREYLKRFPLKRLSKPLRIGHAKLIAQKLRGLSLEKQMEVAVFILSKPLDISEIIVISAKENPQKPIDEVYREIMDESYRAQARTLYFDGETVDALEEACMDRQMYYNDLLMKIIRNWLTKHKYLEKGPVADFNENYFTQRGEVYIKVRASAKRLRECGYQFLRAKGRTKIFQKGIKKGPGFYKAFCKRNSSWLTLTPGNYDAPDEFLKREKRKLES